MTYKNLSQVMPENMDLCDQEEPYGGYNTDYISLITMYGYFIPGKLICTHIGKCSTRYKLVKKNKTEVASIHRGSTQHAVYNSSSFLGAGVRQSKPPLHVVMETWLTLTIRNAKSTHYKHCLYFFHVPSQYIVVSMIVL